MTINADLYERPAVEVLEEADSHGELTVTFIVRASQATSCKRQLYYAAVNEEQTDSTPADSLIRMNMGKALEPLISNVLETEFGFEMDTTIIQDAVAAKWPMVPEDERLLQYVILSDEPGITLSGIPDDVGRHSELTNGELTVIEIKTRNADQYRRTVMEGAYQAHFSAVVQLAMYRQAMVELGIMLETTNCVLVSMNKDNGELNLEWFQPRVLDQALLAVSERLANMVEEWDEKGMSPPEYPVTSWQCKSCFWRTLCGGKDESVLGTAISLADADDPLDFVTLEDTMEALYQWEEQKALEVPSPVDETVIKFARNTILKYLQLQGLTKWEVEGQNGKYSITYTQKENVSVNQQKARFYLTPDQWKEVLEVNQGDPYPTIRKLKK